MVVGFGSAILHQFTDVQLTLLSRADAYQPTAGGLLGLVGVAVVAVAALAGRTRSRSRGSA